MDCGFDISCYVVAALAPVIFWIKVAFWSVAGVLAAALLLWAYRKAGWWGVGIVLSMGVGGAVARLFNNPKPKDPRFDNPPPDTSKPLFPELDDMLKDIFNRNRKK